MRELTTVEITAVSGGVYGAINNAQQTVKAFNDLMGSIFDRLSPTPRV